MRENKISRVIVNAALELHRDLGPGLLESVYEVVLANRLAAAGLRVERQFPIKIKVDGITFDEGFRADLVVNDLVIIEINSVADIAAVHAKQLLTYLRLANKRLGLILNFGAPLLRDGIKRVINGTLEDQ